MIDHDLQRLITRDRAVRLDGLQTDIWAREGRRRAALTASRRLASWQGLVLVFAIVSSAALGASIAARTQPPRAASWLAADGQLAPSTLMFGPQQ